MGLAIGPATQTLPMSARSLPESKPLRARGKGAADIETEIRSHYAAIRSVVPKDASITVLHIGAEQTSVATGPGAEPDAALVLAIGSRKTAADHFRHDPPTPGEVENAIVIVEDEIARARKLIADGSTLFTKDASLREIALIAGTRDGSEMVLSRDAMERTFERLAGVTLGSPASSKAIPGDPAFAATLLILREFMHHLRFSSITVK